jgi:hypothetical protein
VTSTVGGGTSMPSSSPGLPPGWWRNARAQRVAAAGRALFRRPDSRIVRGAVLVLTTGAGSEFVSELLDRSRSLRRQTLVRDRFEQQLTLSEVRCLPGAEEAVRDAIDSAWEAFRGERSGSVETTRLPSVRYESADAATDRLASALAQMNLVACPASGAGAVVAVIDNDLREELVPGLRVTRVNPDRRRIHIGFLVSPGPKAFHGTAVCALIAAAAPGADIAWLARPTNIEFWLPSLLGAAVRYAGQRRLVVNLSWVYEVNALPDNERARFLKAVDAILAEAMHNCVVVAAAGNADDVGDPSPMGYPARCPYVFAVAGASADGRLAAGSRHGKDEGPWCLAPSGWDAQSGLISINGKAFAGTSMAAALVSGLAAAEFDTRKPLDMADHLDALIAADQAGFLRRPRTPTS